MCDLFDEVAFLLLILFELEFETTEDLESGCEYDERFLLKALVCFLFDDFSFDSLRFFWMPGVGECKLSELANRGALGAS